MNKAMELYLEGNLLIARLESINKKFDELIKGRTPDKFAEEATEDEAIEFMILYRLREECKKDYEIWKTKKNEYCKG